MGLENIKLPTYQQDKILHLEDLNRSYLETGKLIAEELLSQDVFQKFSTIRNILKNSFSTKSTFLTSGLKLLFSDEGIFIGSEVKSTALKKYANSLSDIFAEYYLNAKDSEERVNLIANLWVLLSPVSLINLVTGLIYPTNKKLGEILLSQLTSIVSQKFRLDLSQYREFEKLHLMQPILNQLEHDERNHALVDFLSAQRDNLGAKNISLWLDLAEGLSAIANDVSISKLNESFQFGKKEEPAVSRFLTKLEGVKGHPEKEDLVYQEYVDSQFQDISRILMRFKSKITEFKDEDLLISEIELVKTEILSKISLLVSIGSILFDSDSITNKISETFGKLYLKQKSFELILLNTLIPIGIVDLSDSLKMGLSNDHEQDPASLSNYVVNVKTLVGSLESALVIKLGVEFFERLLVALDSPLRTYYVLGCVGPEKIIDITSVAENSSAYEVEALVRFSLLERENFFYQKYISFYKH